MVGVNNLSGNPRNRLKIRGVGSLTEIKFHVEEPQILGSTVRNVIATATWGPGICIPALWARQGTLCS